MASANKRDSYIRSMPYLPKEDRQILDFIVRNEYYELLNGNTIWKEAEDENICHGRTWQSLKSRFKNQIKPRIRNYNLPKDVEEKFLNYEKFSRKEKDEAKAKRDFKRGCLYSDEENSSDRPSKSAKTDDKSSRFRYPSLNVQSLDESPMVRRKDNQNQKESNSAAKSSSSTKSVPSSSVRDHQRKSRNTQDESHPSCSKNSTDNLRSKPSSAVEILLKFCEDVRNGGSPLKLQANSKSTETVKKKKTPSKHNSHECLDDAWKSSKSNKKMNNSKSSRVERDSNSDLSDVESGGSDLETKVRKVLRNCERAERRSRRTISSDDDDCYIGPSQTKVPEAICIDSSSQEDNEKEKVDTVRRNRRTPQKSSRNDSNREEDIRSSRKTTPNHVQKVINIDSDSESRNSDSDKERRNSKSKKTPQKANDDNLSSEEHFSVSSKKNESSNTCKPDKIDSRREINQSPLNKLKTVQKNKNTPRKDNSSNEENYPVSGKRKRLSCRRSHHKNDTGDSSSDESDSSLDRTPRSRSKKRRHENKETPLKEVVIVPKCSHCSGNDSKRDEKVVVSGSESDVKILSDKECDVQRVSKVTRKKNKNVPKESKAVQVCWNGEKFVDDDEEDFMDKGIQVNFDELNVPEGRNVNKPETLQNVPDVAGNSLQENLEKGEISSEDCVIAQEFIKKEKAELEDNSSKSIEGKAIKEKVEEKEVSQLRANPYAQDKEQNSEKVEEVQVPQSEANPIISMIFSSSNPLDSNIIENGDLNAEKIEEREDPQLVSNPLASDVKENGEINFEKTKKREDPQLVANPLASDVVESEKQNSQTMAEQKEKEKSLFVNPKALNELRIKQKKINVLKDYYTDTERKKLRCIINKVRSPKNLD